MSGYNAPTIARRANPYADTADSGGARGGLFSCVLCQTWRRWRRPSVRRLAIGRNKGTAKHWQGIIADCEAGRGVRLSFSLGKPEPTNPKYLYQAPLSLLGGTPTDTLRLANALPNCRIKATPENMRGDFLLPILGRRADV